jgi:3-dehydroquinate dehydratase-2
MLLKTLLVNGPNLNTLGTREPEIYGRETLSDIEKHCKAAAKKLGLLLDCYQSNHEGALVDKIQAAGREYKGLLINAGAYTHTSIAIMDALLSINVPIIEVHMSNIFQRESFRHESYVSKAARGVICGFGSNSYMLALAGMAELLMQNK